MIKHPPHLLTAQGTNQMDTVDSAKKYNIINHLYPARASPSMWPSLSLSAALEVQNLERTKVKESGKGYGGG